MALAAGSVYKLGDPTMLTAAYNATFRYDATTIQVIMTTPAAGGLFKLPGPFTFDVEFNEPLSPASVKTTSLTLSGIAGASVTGATVLSGKHRPLYDQWNYDRGISDGHDSRPAPSRTNSAIRGPPLPRLMRPTSARWRFPFRSSRSRRADR